MISFTVTGEPVPKQSFRFARAGSYQPARVRDWQAMVAWSAKQAMGNMGPTELSVVVTMRFRLGNRRRVDIDNLVKGSLDPLRGIVFKDDSQVQVLHAEKLVDTPPGVTVDVEVAW